MNSKLLSFIKFACVTYLAFLVPKLITIWSEQGNQQTKKLYALLGVENLIYTPTLQKNLKNLRFALICDKNSFDQHKKRTVDLLKEKGFFIKKIFVWGGRNSETKKIFVTKKGRDIASNIPLYFLRGNINRFFRRNTKGIDAFFIDVKDKGITIRRNRRYQVNRLLKLLLDFAFRYEKRIVVLDRPNPLGRIMEGPGAIPWRHGLTIGELFVYTNRYVTKNPANVTIIPLKHWKRGTNIVSGLTQDSLSCFLQPLQSVQPVHVLPDNKGLHHILLLSKEKKLSRWETRYLKRLCWRLGFHCFDYSYVKNNKRLNGVRLSLKRDVSSISAFNTLLTITRFLKNRKQVGISFKKHLDKEFGSNVVRKFLEGYLSFEGLKKNLDKTLSSFYEKSRYCCLYHPLPILVHPEVVKNI